MDMLLSKIPDVSNKFKKFSFIQRLLGKRLRAKNVAEATSSLATPMNIIDNTEVDSIVNENDTLISEVPIPTFNLKTQFLNSPFILHHTPYAQTLEEQEYLIASLSREIERDFTNEFKLVDLLFRQSDLRGVGNKKLFSIVTAWEREYLTSCISDQLDITYINYKFFKKNQDTRSFLQELVDGIEPIENLIIANPQIASLLLLYPNYIKQISRKIRGELIFPCYVTHHHLWVEWDSSFSDAEHDLNHSWKWAFANVDTHSLFLNNNTPNTQMINLEFFIWTVGDANDASLKLYFLNAFAQHAVSYNSFINVEIALPPGRHRLSFVYEGPSIKPENDFRELHCAIVDLKIKNEYDQVMVDTLRNYNEYPLSYLSPHRDKTLRNVLHENGFFEVSAMAKTFTHFSKKKLATTRFHLATQYYQYQAEENDRLISDFDVIWYFAKRTPTFREKADICPP